MSGALVPKFAVIDEFLADSTVGMLHNYAVALEAAFQPMAIVEDRPGSYPAGRRLLVYDGGLGQHGPAFEAAIADRFTDLCAATGVPPFDLARLELQLCAFRDGDHFEPHIDTDRKQASKALESDRVLTAVYYLSGETAFSGGELVLHPFSLDGPPELIAPRRNRLVVFPSFTLHEVLPVAGPRRFRDARLSVNCWMRRPRSNSDGVQ